MGFLKRYLGLAFALALTPAILVAQEGGGDCWLCEGTLVCDLTGCDPVSGTVGCDETLEGEDGKVNCLDDQNGEICELDDFDNCEETEESPDAIAFVALPGSDGSMGPLMRVAQKVSCATGERVGVRVELVEE